MKIATFVTMLFCSAVMLGACGSGGDTDSGSGAEAWEGRTLQEYDVAIGTWEGSSGLVSVECSGSGATPKARLTTPDGFVATTTMPQGGGRASVAVRGPDDREIVWDVHGVPNSAQYGEGEEDDDALLWGPNGAFTTPGDALVEDTENDYVMDLNGVEFSCSRTD